MLDNYIAEVLVSPEELKETIQKLGEKSISDLYFKGSYFLYDRPCSCNEL